MKAFQSTAEFYEILSDDESRIKREGPFLKDLLSRCPGSRVADLACGTGVHAEFFAAHGAQVTAFDLSDEMLDIAKKKRSHEKIEYRENDMRDISGGPWDLILCLGNSLSLLGNLRDIDRTFRAVRESLSPGGLFLGQVLNYRSEKNQKPRQRIEKKNANSGEIVAVKNLVPHENRTLLSLSFFSMGEADESLSETAFLLNLSPEDISNAAHQADMETVETFGSFDGAEYDEATSPDFIFLLK